MMKMAKFTSLLIKYVNGISILNMIKCFIKDIISNYEDSFKSFVNILFNKLLGNSQIENYQSNMIKHLVKILTDINKNTETKTIVFTKYRVTAYYINQILNKSPETMSTIILGYNNNNFMSFSEKDLNTNLEKFKNTSCNILISTDVAEEGIDIQQCNKIIHLDQLETIKSFIQKNGRGRIAESEIHLFVTKCERQNYEKLLKNIKNGVLIIKDIIRNDSIKPMFLEQNYINNLDYLETSQGARVYLSYAKKMLNEFLSKLDYDGYNWLREEFKYEVMKDEKISPCEDIYKKDSKYSFRPYLYLCPVLEKINKIYDTEEFFRTFEKAEEYKNKYSDYFYLKAIKVLHHNHYLDDNLLFSKQFDDLLHMDSYQIKIPAEPLIKIKQQTSLDKDYVSCHIYEMDPQFININLNSPKFKDKCTAFISNFTSCTNFDVFIRNSELSKLYFYNKTQSDFDSDSNFKEKPKLPWNFYNVINVKFGKNQTIIKLSPRERELVDFFHTYHNYLISDSECTFYFHLFKDKFSFKNLFKDSSVHLKRIFNTFKGINDLEKHVNQATEIDLSNDLIKFVILKKENGYYTIHVDYLLYILENVKKDIAYYSKFLDELTRKKENYQIDELTEISKNFQDNYMEQFQINTISRNLINFTKCYVFPYSETSIKGSFRKKGLNKSMLEFYLEKFGLITENDKDYIRTKILDFNAKIFKYRVNLTVKRDLKYNQKKIIKRFNFLPTEILSRIDYISLDELFYYTLVPILMNKIQNNVKYFYYAKCLSNEYKIIKTDKINMSLIIQALNSKTTLEALNYERLEFLGDAVLKFLSSWEVFKRFKIGNKDLLAYKRRKIENNDNLFNKAFDKKLFNYLNTTQFSFKTIRQKTEFKLFNIGNNRIISKNLIKNRSAIVSQNEEETKKEDLIPDLPESIVNDKFAFNTYDEKQEDPEYNIEKEYFTLTDIKNVNDNLEIVENNSERLLYKKNLADLVVIYINI